MADFLRNLMAMLFLGVLLGGSFLLVKSKKEKDKKIAQINSIITVSGVTSLSHIANTLRLNPSEVVKLVEQMIAEASVNSEYKALRKAHIDYNRHEIILDSNADSNSRALPGMESVAETLKDTVDTFKSAFGIEIKDKNGNKPPEKTTGKCSSCGAPLSGFKGKIVRCQYCNTDQQL